jgi:hypothetical protein
MRKIIIWILKKKLYGSLISTYHGVKNKPISLKTTTSS